MFINTMAVDAETGAHYPSKKSLRIAMETEPSRVRFIRTSILEEALPSITGDASPIGVRLSVVGPDAYNNRKWYSVVQLHNGKVLVR